MGIAWHSCGKCCRSCHYKQVRWPSDWHVDLASFCDILVFQGRFEILTLGGSFLFSESGDEPRRYGGMNVSLSGPDGRLMGGGVAGKLVAASPVQVHFFSWFVSVLFRQLQEEKTVHMFLLSHLSLCLIPYTLYPIVSYLSGPSSTSVSSFIIYSRKLVWWHPTDNSWKDYADACHVVFSLNMAFILQVVVASFGGEDPKISRLAKMMGNLSAPPKVATAGQSSSSSGGPGSPPNQSAGTCNNNNEPPQGISDMQLK